MDDSLEVATSEEWGAGALAGFGSDDTSGAPVYCDSNGQLRTVPEHTSDVFEASGSQGGTAIPDGAAVSGATTSIVVNNPSALRTCNIFASASVIEQMGFPMGNVSFAPRIEVTRNAVPLHDVTGLFTIQGDSGFASSFWWTYDASIIDTIGAGASVTYAAECSVDASAGTSGDFASAVGIRGMVVTQ